MFTPSRILGVVCGTAVLVCLLACGAQQKIKQAAERAQRSNDLKQIVNAMINYHDANQTFPPDQQTIIQWLQKMDPQSTALVQSGQFTILYGNMRMLDMTEGTSNTIVAYDNQMSGGGRLVATADGAVMNMTDGEFATKPRLKPKAGGA